MCYFNSFGRHKLDLKNFSSKQLWKVQVWKFKTFAALRFYVKSEMATFEASKIANLTLPEAIDMNFGKFQPRKKLRT